MRASADLLLGQQPVRLGLRTDRLRGNTSLRDRRATKHLGLAAGQAFCPRADDPGGE